MHQKHPPAKIAVLVSAAALPLVPEAMTKAARNAAVSVAQMHLANMKALRFDASVNLRAARMWAKSLSRDREMN
jgi:hypothetical protein